MPTLETKIQKAQKQSARLLQIARHRVTRWFHPAIAIERKRSHAPHPTPAETRSPSGYPETRAAS